MRFDLFTLLFALFSIACGKNAKNTPGPKPQFQLLKKAETGLNFENKLTQSPEFNALTYMYFYNGGGLAAGDFNKDGLVDLYFTANMAESKLFLNRGNLKFEDVTQKAGVAALYPPNDGLETGQAWKTGASVVDINDDGLLDIYVSQVGDFKTLKGRNQLFVCREIKDGIPVFEEKAAQFGLDLKVFGTQAAFFDFDKDGDLDIFQLNHSVHANGTFGQKSSFKGTQHPLSGDKLLRNDGNGKYTETTLQAGINSSVIGYGLGLVMGDVNLDGWPDIYIGNDFHENDYLYLNQKDGTFREVLTEQIQHTSQFSMGVDIADINNDAFPEIFSLDMLPEDPFILKSSLGEDEYGIYNFKLTYGYNHQFARNTLQLNNGDGTFSEIGAFAGVHATDWSWATLFFDFDNDGNKDLFVGNGIVRRMNDIDYANFRTDSDVRFKQATDNLENQDLRFIDKMPRVKLPNKFFKNTGNLKFDDIEKQVAGDLPTFSNGAVTVDLDNDGDLDVVTNNLEDEPFIYKNLETENKTPGRNFLNFNLLGSPGNRNAIGARVVVFKNGERIYHENFPARGYQSSAQTGLHIGIGDSTLVDSVLVIWPDDGFQKLPKLAFNQTHEIAWKAGLPKFDFKTFPRKTEKPFLFDDATAASKLNFSHEENEFVEFNREFLMPHMVSTEGPALAVGDVNGDGREDLFFGASKWFPSKMFLQKTDGTFQEQAVEAFKKDSVFEDVDAVFSDIENDGDLDLVVASGGNEFWGTHEALKQRYYLNDGKGNLQRIDFQGVFMTASCVLPCDFNKDGLVDFFFGARAMPKNYGLTPQSALFLNKGNGQFEEVSEKIGGGLREAGLVKNGAWADLDGDGDQDLLLALEWEPLTIFENTGGKFEKRKINEMSGWWNFAQPIDFDGDGDLDILAGNLGQNAKFKPTPEQPVRMYVSDFDGNEKVEQLLTYHVKGREIPFHNHREMMKAMPPLKKKFLLAKDFAKASPADLVGAEKLGKAVKREANTFQSMLFENTGKGFQFVAHALPDALQFSTLNAVSLADLNGDGRQEAILGGNFYECNVEMGRYDANFGNVLSFSKNGKMEVWPLGDLRVKGQVRRIRPVKIKGETAWVFARNNDAALLVRRSFKSPRVLSK